MREIKQVKLDAVKSQIPSSDFATHLSGGAAPRTPALCGIRYADRSEPGKPFENRSHGQIMTLLMSASSGEAASSVALLPQAAAARRNCAMNVRPTERSDSQNHFSTLLTSSMSYHVRIIRGTGRLLSYACIQPKKPTITEDEANIHGRVMTSQTVKSDLLQVTPHRLYLSAVASLQRRARNAHQAVHPRPHHPRQHHQAPPHQHGGNAPWFWRRIGSPRLRHLPNAANHPASWRRVFSLCMAKRTHHQLHGSSSVQRIHDRTSLQTIPDMSSPRPLSYEPVRFAGSIRHLLPTRTFIE